MTTLDHNNHWIATTFDQGELGSATVCANAIGMVMSQQKAAIAEAESRGLAWWIEKGEVKSAPKIDGRNFSTHNYGGSKSQFQLGRCIYGCGCEMYQTTSYGPVDPFGPCPNNPKTKDETSVVIVLHGKDILVLKRGATAPWMPNLWNFPGGMCNKDEKPIYTAARELLEESGITANILELNLVDSILVDGAYLVHFFAYRGLGDKPPIKLDSENTEYQWIPVSEINTLDCVPGIVEACSRLKRLL